MNKAEENVVEEASEAQIQELMKQYFGSKSNGKRGTTKAPFNRVKARRKGKLQKSARRAQHK